MYVNVIKDVMAYYRSSYDKLTLDSRNEVGILIYPQCNDNSQSRFYILLLEKFNLTMDENFRILQKLMPLENKSLL